MTEYSNDTDMSTYVTNKIFLMVYCKRENLGLLCGLTLFAYSVSVF